MERDDDVAVPIDPDLAPSGPARLARRGRPSGRAGPDVLAAIAAGGALGAPARYEMTRLIHVAKGTFPWATFWTNVTGSLALGFLLIVILERFPGNRYLRPFVAIGFIGAYTTFSTYMVDTDILIKDGHAAIGVTYLLGSAIAGFGAVWVGIAAGRLVPVKRRLQPRAPE